MRSQALISFAAFLLLACNNKQSTDLDKAEGAGNRYAEGFSVQTVGNAKLVEVTYPFQGATSGYSYLLVPRGEDIPAHDEKTKVVFVPVESIVCTSTTHIP